MIDAGLKGSDETLERLPGDGISVLQKKSGYRFSVDSLILADFINPKSAKKAVELGSGSGVISLLLAHRHEDLGLIGYELQHDQVEMANRSVQLNGMEGRALFRNMDIRHVPDHCGPSSCDIVFFNPPYRKAGSGRISSGDGKATARHELNGSIEDFVRTASYLVRQKGRVYAIYPAKRSATLVTVMKNCGVEPKRMRFVHSRQDLPASFILLEGTKGGGEEVHIPPPLYIYVGPKRYSEEMESIFGGSSLRKLSFDSARHES